uniref:Uncharacterized protein n=1 Tax=Setaria viridis TaxID=4556 RepID=A0A4U6TF32_SETVI|nr:hypothetical protein SEVIR_8G138800v2 [Setaria viridis]
MFETHPKETVTFALFAECRFAVPSSAFFRGILEFYSLQYNRRWLNQPIDSERDQVDELLARIDVLKEKGLTGAVVAASFLKRRVQPLQLRQTWGYEYSGRSDPSRMSPDDISIDEIMVRLNRMLKNVSGIPRIVEEFNHLNKPREEDVLLFFSPPPPPGADATKDARRVFWQRLPGEPSEPEEEDEEFESSSSSESDTTGGFTVQPRVYRRRESSPDAPSHLDGGNSGGGLAPPLKKQRTVDPKRLPEKELKASKLLLMKFTGGGEGMGTSGDHIAAAAQVISSGVGDNREAPPVAPSSVLNPSDLPKRLAGKAALVPRRSTK